MMRFPTAYVRSLLVLLALVVAYAIYDVNRAYEQLVADDNPFAGLVWNALPTRIFNDGITAALIALPVAWIYMQLSNRGVTGH